MSNLKSVILVLFWAIVLVFQTSAFAGDKSLHIDNVVRGYNENKSEIDWSLNGAEDITVQKFIKLVNSFPDAKMANLSCRDLNNQETGYLSQLKKLQHLNLFDTLVSDQEVMKLVDDLPSLVSLNLKRCPNVSLKSIEYANKKRPDLEVEWGI